jgi:hypothetical protein
MKGGRFTLGWFMPGLPSRGSSFRGNCLINKDLLGIKIKPATISARSPEDQAADDNKGRSGQLLINWGGSRDDQMLPQVTPKRGAAQAPVTTADGPLVSPVRASAAS